MRKTIIVLLILSVLIIGCIEEQLEQQITGSSLMVKTICEDKVICYRNQLGIHSGVSCFRDADLVLKYCGI